MNNTYDNTTSYHIFMYDRILKLAPIVGACAAITFTIARLFGWFSFVELLPLLCFDGACIIYFPIAYGVRKRYFLKSNVDVNEDVLCRIDYLLDSVVIFQWNLITYIFPTKSFWGFAPMFVLLTAFMFRKRAVLIEIIGISLSIIISWLIIGDKLLPYEDSLYYENLTLRIIALVISFSVIYLLTNFAEKFTILVRDNVESLEEKNKELENTSKEIIDFTADIIEKRDATSGSHVKRLKDYTNILAKQVAFDHPEYALTTDAINQITLACVLHDVGKICIPDSILLKPGRLTKEEFELMKTHTTLGAQIINSLPDSVGQEYKKYCREICLCHHEKYDGNGYPNGLEGDNIPISAQIVSVVDCFDALSNERPYKAALPGEVAINMILNGECGVFSDKMKQSILNCKDKILNL